MKLDLRFNQIIKTADNGFLGLTRDGKLVGLILVEAAGSPAVIKGSVVEVVLEDQRIEGHLPGDSCKCTPCPANSDHRHAPNLNIPDDLPDTCQDCKARWNGYHWEPL
jgi:hypothetical protein